MAAVHIIAALAGFLGTGPLIVWLADGAAGRLPVADFPRP